MSVRVIHPITQEQAEILRLVGELVGSENLQQRISTVLANLSTLDTITDGIQSDLDNGTDGLGALKALIDSILTDTGTSLPADIAGVLAEIQSATYGLAAIKTQTAALETDTQDIQTKIGAPAGASVSADVAGVRAEIGSETYGLAAIKTQTAALETDTQDLQSKIGTPAGASVSADVAGVRAEIDSATYGLAATKTQTAAIEADTQDLQSKIGAPTGASISADIAALKSVADNINNSTRVNASVPSLLEIPEAGTSYYRVTHNLFDSAGLPTDADADAVYFRVVDAAGTAKSGVYFSDNTGTAITAASGLTGTAAAFNGWYALNTTPVGRGLAFIGIATTATQEGLTVEFGHVDASDTTKAIVVTRATQAVDYLQAQGQAGVTADAVWDEATADHQVAGSAGKALTDILADTDAVQTDLADGGRLDLILDELTAQGDTNESKLDTAITNIGNLSTKVDTETGALDSAVAVIDGYHDVPGADSANNAQVRDVIGNKTDTLAGTSVVAMLKQILASEQSGYLFKAAKSSAALAQAASEVVNLSGTEGFDLINGVIKRLSITLTGASTNYTIEIFENAAATKLLWSAVQTANDDTILDMDTAFMNQNGTPSKNCYVKITNNADTGSTTFAVEVRGEKRSDTLA